MRRSNEFSCLGFDAPVDITDRMLLSDRSLKEGIPRLEMPGVWNGNDGINGEEMEGDAMKPPKPPDVRIPGVNCALPMDWEACVPMPGTLAPG